MKAQTWYVRGVVALVGLGIAVVGVWCLAAPESFAEWAGFPPHVHFLHDMGAFQLGLAAGLLLALIWADALATVLAGFLLANTVHTVNHVIDLDHGGSVSQVWVLGVVSVAVAVALGLRLRQLGYVVGYVGETASGSVLAPFVRQKTVLLTTYRRDGTPGASPVSIVVDGDHAYVRSFERSLKTRRLRRNPDAELAASNGRGTPTGTALPVRLRLLHGDESRRAARLLARKYPFLHGVLVPATHRIGRAKYGRTVHFELAPRG